MGGRNKEVFMRYKIETERADLFDVNILIVMSVKLDKEVPFEMLKTAFENACRCHEVLRSKIVIEQSGEAYYVDNEEIASSISETKMNLPQLINDNERKRFRIEEGEFIRAFSSPDGIVFMMHHLGGDGKSLVYFIETFMNCLSGKECEFLPFRNLTLNDLPENSRLPFYYEVLVKSWNKKWLKDKRAFGFEDMDKAYSDFWRDNKTIIEITRYEGDELKSLLKDAKESGATLTSYLIADMIKDSDRKMDIGLAVDGRPDKNRSMGNQATGISVEYKYNDKKSLGENAKAILDLMQKKLSNGRERYLVLQFMGILDSTLKDSLNLVRAGYFSNKLSDKIGGLLGYGDRVKDISITNLTRVDIPQNYGSYQIREIVFVPPVVSYAKNVIGIVTIGDAMTVSRHVYLDKN